MAPGTVENFSRGVYCIEREKLREKSIFCKKSTTISSVSMTTEARAVFLAKLITTKMNINNAPSKTKPVKSCEDCHFSTNNTSLLTRHRNLMHGEAKSTRGRKRKEPETAPPVPAAKRALPEPAPESIVNSIFLQDSQELPSQEPLVDTESQESLLLPSSQHPGLGDSQPSQPINTQQFDARVEEQLDKLDEADEADEINEFREIFGEDEEEYELEQDNTTTGLTAGEMKQLLAAARDNIEQLQTEKRQHKETKCEEKIAELEGNLEKVKMELLKSQKDKEVEVKRREKVEALDLLARRDIQTARKLAVDLKERLSVKNTEVSELRNKVGITSAKMLSMQGMMSSPPPETPASAASPSLGDAAKQGDKTNSVTGRRKPPAKEIKCRHSDSDQMCTRSRCSFYHPRPTDHCQVYLAGGACLTQSCMRRHNDTERRKYADKQRSNDRKRNRDDAANTSSKRSRATSQSSPQARREVSDYSRSRANSNRYEDERNFQRAGRRAAGRSSDRRQAPPSRR